MFVRTICLLLVCHSVVYAQKADRRRVTSSSFRKQEAVKQLLEESKWRFGNLYLLPQIGLRQFGYDSNVFSEGASMEQNDFSIAPQVGIRSFYRPSARWIWENRLSYDYLYYNDLENLRGSEYGGETRLYGLFKRAYIDFGTRYNQDRQRLNSEIKVRATSERLQHSFNYTYQPGARSQLTLSGRFGSLEFDKDDLEAETALRFRTLERDDSEYLLRYNYKWTNGLWPFVEVSLQNFDFKQENNPRDDTTFTSTFLGMRTQNARRLTMEAKLGLVSMDFLPAGVALVDMDDDVLSYEGFLRYKMTRKYYVESSLLRTPLFSQAEGYTNFISSKQSVEFGYETRRKIRIGPEILFGSNAYEKTFDSVANPVLREDDFRGFNINVTFPFRKLFEWRLSAGYQERDSNTSGKDKGYVINSIVRLKRE